MKLVLLFIIPHCFVSALLAQTDLEVSDSIPDENGVYTYVDRGPQFPGGDEALLNFINKNLVYPQKERDCDIQAKVLLQFVVDTNGSVKNIKVIRSFGTLMDNEAVRVAKMLPDFTPAYKNGKRVSVYFNLPMVFKLQ